MTLFGGCAAGFAIVIVDVAGHQIALNFNRRVRTADVLAAAVARFEWVISSGRGAQRWMRKPQRVPVLGVCVGI